MSGDYEVEGTFLVKVRETVYGATSSRDAVARVASSIGREWGPTPVSVRPTKRVRVSETTLSRDRRLRGE